LRVVSDPERDLVHVVDVRSITRRATVRLPMGSQPTRAAEDRSGGISVVLRGTGQVAKIGLSSGSLLRTESVCPEPRGIAFDRAKDAMVVACASGELVTLPSSGSSSVRRLGTDLRDVVIQGTSVRVSTFRAATLLEVGPEKIDVLTLPTMSLPPVNGNPASFDPTVAWRAVPGPNGSTVVAHQRSVTGDISTISTGMPPTAVVPYYTNPCSSAVVRSVLTMVNDQGQATSSIEVPGALPLDVAVSSTEIAVIAAGNSQLTRIPLRNMTSVSGGLCGPIGAPAPRRDPMTRQPMGDLGQPVGVTYVGNESLVVHSRSPARLVFYPSASETRFQGKQMLELEGSFAPDPEGQATFHTSTRAGLACASCHPEGQEDGHVWTFLGEKRRTQPLSGGLTQTAPFHWKGDRVSLASLMDDTFVARMGGVMPPPETIHDLSRFLDALPAPKAPTRDTPVDMIKGRAAFEKAGCDSCHAGQLLTNAATMSVGTGGSFQVPSLRGLSRRAPYMHDGCAQTLSQRFDDLGCGGVTHGDVSGLTSDERDLMIGYLGQL
jgi:hypothetical protein